MHDILPYPNITAKDTETQVKQINNYLVQMKEALEFAFMGISSDNLSAINSLSQSINTGNEEKNDQMMQMSSKLSSNEENAMSAIEQTANSIMLEVGKKTSADDVKAIINMNANGEIEMSGNKISIASTNFNLTKDGKVTAKDMTITGGSVAIDNGSNETLSSVTVKASNKGYSSKMSAYGLAFDTSSGIYTEVRGGGIAIGKMTNGTPVQSMHINDDEIWINNLVVHEDAIVDGTLYTKSGTVSKSDREAKDEIAELDAVKSSNFIYSLKPCEYKYKDGTSDRLHHGFIAQEVKESMGEDDWGLYVDNGEYKALRYEEIIADLVATVQSQNERIKYLESQIKTEGE